VSQARIVEFVGIPCCGKSTVSHAAARTLRDVGIETSESSYRIAHQRTPAGRRIAKLGFALRCVAVHPLASATLLLEVARTGQRRRREGLAAAFNLLYVCGLVAERARRPGLHLLDQGFFGALWSVCFAAGSAERLARLMAVGIRCCGGRPCDAVLLVEADLSDCLAWLWARPGRTSRLERQLAAGEGETALLAAQQALQIVRSLIEVRDAPWVVRHFRNKHESDAGAREIGAWLEGLRSPVPSQPDKLSVRLSGEVSR
jgi:hypothetical protein